MKHLSITSFKKMCYKCKQEKLLNRFPAYSDICSACCRSIKKSLKMEQKRKEALNKSSIKRKESYNSDVKKTIKIKKSNFHTSKRWRELRAFFISKNDKICCCCGIDVDGQTLHVDHIKPKSKYPDLALDENNLQILCRKCNFAKNTHHETDYRIGK